MTDHECECECGHWECMHCGQYEDCKGCSDCGCTKSKQEVESDPGSTHRTKPGWYNPKSNPENQG